MAPSATASSRAVIRLVDPGNDAVCARCAKQIKFSAKAKGRQVIANVYEARTWRRVEHFHEECYAEAGEPFGSPASPLNARAHGSGPAA